MPRIDSLFTVLGSTGLIGRALCDRLRALGYRPFEPERSLLGVFDKPLGHAFYCIGNDRVASDPKGVVEAELSVLGRVLHEASYDSFTYLSSTRVYLGSPKTEEDAEVAVRWNDPSVLFNAVKLAGEALCLSISMDTVRVVRLSNVFGANPGSHSFLPALIQDALARGRIDLRVSPDSEKDYIDVEDVATLLPEIAMHGNSRRYNLASGRNVAARTIAEGIQELTGCEIRWDPDAPSVRFPVIDIDRIRKEFGLEARRIEESLPSLVAQFRAAVADA